MWRRCLDWIRRAFEGRSPDPTVRFESDDPPLDRLRLHVPVGGSYPREAEGALLSDRLPLHAIRDIFHFASRRALPVDEWVIWGLHESPRRLGVVARWVAQLARASRIAPVVVRTDAFSDEETRRLEALLGRLDCDVSRR